MLVGTQNPATNLLYAFTNSTLIQHKMYTKDHILIEFMCFVITIKVLLNKNKIKFVAKQRNTLK